MSLRTMLGADADRVHEQVDALLDSEDGVIVLVDKSRAISYAQGFGISACQLELLTVEIERAVRATGGRPQNNRNRRDDGEAGEESDDSGRGAGVCRHLGRLATGATAVWLTGEVRVLGLVALPTAIVASLLVAGGADLWIESLAEVIPAFES